MRRQPKKKLRRSKNVGKNFLLGMNPFTILTTLICVIFCSYLSDGGQQTCSYPYHDSGIAIESFYAS